MLLFLNYKIGMDKKQILTGLIAILLAACTISPSSPKPSSALNLTGIPSPTLPPSLTPTDTSTPTLIPSPTLTPEVRLEAGDQAFFNGDYLRAQTEYQAALSSALD